MNFDPKSVGKHSNLKCWNTSVLGRWPTGGVGTRVAAPYNFVVTRGGTRWEVDGG